MSRTWVSRLGLLLAGLTLCVSTLPAREGPKVVILGFDGADSRLVEAWMEQGELPPQNLN